VARKLKKIERHVLEKKIKNEEWYFLFFSAICHLLKKPEDKKFKSNETMKNDFYPQKKPTLTKNILFIFDIPLMYLLNEI
jgi:hypothetical protein